MACVYRHIRIDKNVPFYIGAAKTLKRAYSRRSRNKKWVEVASMTDIEVDILFDNISIEDAYMKEKEFIALYGRQDLHGGTLVNMTDGGVGSCGAIVSESSKKKKSEKMKNIPRPWQLNKPTWSKGVKFSEEYKEKLRKPHGSIRMTDKRRLCDKSKQKAIVASSLDGSIIREYESVTQASAHLNIDISSICRVANGTYKSSKGFIFKYK